MRDEDEFAFDQPSWLQRFGLPVACVLAIGIVAASAYVLLKGGTSKLARPHQEEHITQVQLPPPPPPPPPPKTPPPPKKTEEAQRQKEAAPQKAEAKPAPKAPTPPAAVTTSIQGNGPGSLAVGNGGGGDCIGTGCGTGDGSGGDNDAYYSSLVKTQIEEALKRDEKLKYARYRTTISFSLDAAGHVAGAMISSFDGDADVRAEVESVIRAISTGDRPPADMLTKQFSVRITERARG
jgi:type IV secretory pathway VirB10-like protein